MYKGAYTFVLMPRRREETEEIRVEKQADYHNKNKTQKHHFNITCILLFLVRVARVRHKEKDRDSRTEQGERESIGLERASERERKREAHCKNGVGEPHRYQAVFEPLRQIKPLWNDYRYAA